MARSSQNRVAVTDAMLERLSSHQRRTGFGITALFTFAERYDHFEPSGSLTTAVFENIVRRRTKSVILADYERIIAAYEAIPEDMWGKAEALGRRVPRIPLTDDLKDRLQAMLDQSTLSRAKLLKHYGAPADLTSTKLGLMLNRENTTIKVAHAEFLERVIAHRSKNADSA